MRKEINPTLIGQRVKARRRQLHMTQDELAAKLGYTSKATISKIETGVNDIALTKVDAFAKALLCDPRYLLGVTDSPDQDADEFFREIEANEPPDHMWVPIVGRVAAGQPMYAEDNIEGYMLVDGQLGLDLQGLLFALRIAGDSMEPEIKKGSIALVRHQEDADTGDVVIVRVNGEDATCKRIKKTAAGLTLLPANPAYDMRAYTWAEIAEIPVSIVGKVIEVRTKY